MIKEINVNRNMTVTSEKGSEKGVKNKTVFERMKPLVTKVLVPTIVLLGIYIGVQHYTTIQAKNAKMLKLSQDVAQCVETNTYNESTAVKSGILLCLMADNPEAAERTGICIKTIAEKSKSEKVVEEAISIIASFLKAKGPGPASAEASDIAMLVEDVKGEKHILKSLRHLRQMDIRYLIKEQIGVDIGVQGSDSNQDGQTKL